MLIILLSIRYSSVCACRSQIYCCLSGTTCILVIVQYITTSLLLLCTGILYHSCVCRGSVIMRLVSRMNSQRGRRVCWKSKKTCFLESGLMRNIYTRYHICLMRVFIILLSIRYNMCACRSPIYCCLSGTTCIFVIVQYITTLLLLCTWYTIS